MTSAIAEFLENRNTKMLTGRFSPNSDTSKFVGVYYTPTVCVDDEKNEFGIVYVAENQEGNDRMLWARTYLGFDDCRAILALAVDEMIKTVYKS
jgi:hypothetical protein